MIKTELEWHSNNEAPTPENHWSEYLINAKVSGWFLFGAVFDEDGFKYFMDSDGYEWNLDQVVCWAKLPSSTDVKDLFEIEDDLITDCLCGDTTPHEPWWEDCGLGKSEEHCRAASPDEQEYMNRLIDEMRETKLALDKLEEEPEESFIVANIAQCTLCKDIIESHSRNDFVSCSCNSVAVDGGLGYLRRVGGT